MDLLIQASFFLWITGGLLSMGTYPCSIEDEDKEYGLKFRHVFRNVCYEFAQKPQNWSQARESCEERGGKLLNVLNCNITNFLQNFQKERNSTNLTWWVGKRVLEKPQGLSFVPTVENYTFKSNGITPLLCNYAMMDPFQLVTTTNCSQRRGYLCTLDLKWSTNNQTKKQSTSDESKRIKRNFHYNSFKRLPRNVADMGYHVNNIEKLLQVADRELLWMELTAGQPSDENMIKFLEYLLKGVEMMTPQDIISNNDTSSHIIRCSGGIYLLSLKKCDYNPKDKAMFDLVFQIYQKLSLLIATATNKTIILKHPTGFIYQSSFTPMELENAVLGSEEEGTYVKLPSFSALQSQLKNFPVVNAQLATFSENPYDSDENITGTVCSLVLSHGSSTINVENLSELIEIFLPRSGVPSVSQKCISLKNGSTAMTTFNITDPNVTVIFTVEPSVNVSLQLLLSQGSPPNHTHYDHSTILHHTGGYRWLVTPEMMAERTGVWYVNASLFNSTWSQGLKINITTFTSKCMYWDTVQETWSIAGCWVGVKSTPEQAHCLCNHLTLFGTSFFVMPNYVDLSRTAELFATVGENYVVVVLLSTFFGLYLMTLLWACYSDRRALTRRKLTLLEDNHPCAHYNYLLNVQTGHRSGAGTSAKVTLKLIGSEGESELHHLTDPDKPVFERRGEDMFLVTTPFPLGELQGIRLWHDNSGGHPSWYLQKVTIQDLQTRQVWHFLSSSWLSSDKGDGMIKKTFNTAKKNEIASFRNIFQTRTSSGFRDEHIWVSIVDPPWRSPFTRAQRVSCCMSLLLCTMAINIAFWNIPQDQESPVIFQIGSLSITWQEIMVGVESGFLMFPINILIITIFRSIKPRSIQPTEKSKNSNSMQDSIPCAVTMPTILKETEDMVNILSRSQRNKVPELKERLESYDDLCSALDRVHDVIQLMQGESESDPHWVYCSKFVLYSLHHLSMSLGRLDGGNFPSTEAHQQVLSTVNLLLKKAEMVFSSHMAYSPLPVPKGRRKSGCWLPWWFVFLGWFLLLSISGVSTYFTLIYSFDFGREKSIQWVISLGLSLFQSIFILQPLKVIGLAILFALLLKPVAVEESEEIELLLAEQQARCKLYSSGETC